MQKYKPMNSSFDTAKLFAASHTSNVLKWLVFQLDCTDRWRSICELKKTFKFRSCIKKMIKSYFSLRYLCCKYESGDLTLVILKVPTYAQNADFTTL